MIAGPIARLGGELEVRIRHQRELAASPAQRGQLFVRHRWKFAADDRRVKRPDDGDNAVWRVAGRDRLRDPSPHERLADDVLGPPTRRVLLQVAEDAAELE